MNMNNKLYESCRICFTSILQDNPENILSESKLKMLERTLSQLDILILPDSTLCWICRIKAQLENEILRYVIEKDYPEILSRLIEADDGPYMKIEVSTPELNDFAENFPGGDKTEQFVHEDVKDEKLCFEQHRIYEETAMKETVRNEHVKENASPTDLYVAIRKEFACYHCPHKTDRKDSLILHLLTHQKSSDSTAYKCTKCSFTTKWKSSLSQHMRLHKKPEDLRFFHCAHCKFSTTFKSKLARHIKRKEYHCDSCNFRCSKLCLLGQHLKEEHNSVLKPKHRSRKVSIERSTPSKLIEIWQFGQCDEMLVIKTTEFDLNDKKYIRFQCQLCDHSTSRTDNIKEHIKKHCDKAGIDCVKCSFCNYSTKYKRNLRVHVVKHHRC